MKKYLIKKITFTFSPLKCFKTGLFAWLSVGMIKSNSEMWTLRSQLQRDVKQLHRGFLGGSIVSLSDKSHSEGTGSEVWKKSPVMCLGVIGHGKQRACELIFQRLNPSSRPSKLSRPTDIQTRGTKMLSKHFHHSTPSKSFRRQCKYWMTFLFHFKFIRKTESGLDSKTLIDPKTPKVSNCIQQMFLKCNQHIFSMNKGLVFWTGVGFSQIIMNRFVWMKILDGFQTGNHCP